MTHGQREMANKTTRWRSTAQTQTHPGSHQEGLTWLSRSTAERAQLAALTRHCQTTHSPQAQGTAVDPQHTTGSHGTLVQGEARRRALEHAAMRRRIPPKTGPKRMPPSSTCSGRHQSNRGGKQHHKRHAIEHARPLQTLLTPPPRDCLRRGTPPPSASPKDRRQLRSSHGSSP